MQFYQNALRFAVKGDLSPPQGQSLRTCKEWVGGAHGFSKRVPAATTTAKAPWTVWSAKFAQIFWGKGSAALELKQAWLEAADPQSPGGRRQGTV